MTFLALQLAGLVARFWRAIFSGRHNPGQCLPKIWAGESVAGESGARIARRAKAASALIGFRRFRPCAPRSAVLVFPRVITLGRSRSGLYAPPVALEFSEQVFDFAG